MKFSVQLPGFKADMYEKVKGARPGGDCAFFDDDGTPPELAFNAPTGAALVVTAFTKTRMNRDQKLGSLTVPVDVFDANADVRRAGRENQRRLGDARRGAVAFLNFGRRARELRATLGRPRR